MNPKIEAKFQVFRRSGVKYETPDLAVTEGRAFDQIMQGVEQALLLFNEWLAREAGCNICKKVPPVTISELALRPDGSWVVSEMNVLDMGWAMIWFNPEISKGSSNVVSLYVCEDCLKEKGIGIELSTS